MFLYSSDENTEEWICVEIVSKLFNLDTKWAQKFNKGNSKPWELQPMLSPPFHNTVVADTGQ